MLSRKYITKPRALFSPLLLLNNNNSILISSSFTSPSSIIVNPCYFYDYTTTTQAQQVPPISAKDVVLSFKEWFKTQNKPLLDRIFEILSAQDDQDLTSRWTADLALSQLGIRLSESFVLELLNYGNGKQDVLSCLKFFDWAGRQPGFYHTRVTYIAVFKILSRARLMSLMLDFLDNFMKRRYCHNFYSTLVMGYAVAGRPDIALQLFGRMRFQGLDLDAFAYHVLLNALVEESCFDAVDVISKQISLRGFENDITPTIIIKSLCKKNHLEQAELYLHQLVTGGKPLSGHVLGVLVDAFCKSSRFEHAANLLDKFHHLEVMKLEHAYGIWLKNLVHAGRLDAALHFLKSKKPLEGYVPHVFRYNVLVSRLLRQNRLPEVFDLLMEMKDGHIAPDKATMNTALCFFCKAGMVDVALQLYNSRSEFGLSPNGLAYNYLINTLCGDGSTDEAYTVLRNSIDQGFFPGRKTFSILADALCREGKLDKMKELVIVALERNFMPSDSTYDNFISALCRASRVEDGYLIHGELNRMNKVTTRSTYCRLIHGFNKSNRGDIAARLLMEMQEKGHKPTRAVFRAVIRSLCDMENPEKQFLHLLERQLSQHEANCQIFNFFIDGAGHAKKPELAREVYKMMERRDIKHNASSHILMLQCYLKSGRIADALNFFNDLQQEMNINKKLYHTMIVGLCKASKLDISLEFFEKMKKKELVPSVECYEVIIHQFCLAGKYDSVVKLINELERVNRHVTSFIGNVLLFNSLKTQDLYEAWIRLRDPENETSKIPLLGQLIGAFSGRIRVDDDIENLENMIQQCFPLDIYTYNLLLRRLSMSEIDRACELFNQICQKGYEPNQWTYDILVHGLYKYGRTDEAKRRLEEMFQRGLVPTFRTQGFITG